MNKFCDSLTRFSRRPTDEVRIGTIGVGGDNPIRLQSMTNTDTNDTEASAAQVERIAAAGGEIVRLTAQGRREAANLGRIRALLDSRGCRVPLVADIHFLPSAALVAAEQVEKVRINPGNWNERGGEFDELLSACRRRGVALRIGVNHGSLSPSIMERYGDTVEGMVASAMEYLRRCREASFGQVVVSIKSSNVRVMVQAYRMLVAAMRREGMRYPLHLGVTEAGDDREGRVKSAVGIGALLCDGIGDTIRVSLTEAPEREIPVARTLAGYFAGRENHAPIPDVDESLYSPYEYRRRMSAETDGIGGNLPPVIASEIPGVVRSRLFEARVADIDSIPDGRVVLLSTDNLNGVAEQRAFFLKMIEKGKTNPVVIRRTYDERDAEALQVKAAADLGPLLLDGFAEEAQQDDPALLASLVGAGIPVMGHLGLTPQSIHKYGTYAVRAKEQAEADKLVRDAHLLEEAGCFGLVLEKIPAVLGTRVSQELEIPTIGIGAGGGTDGQVLVIHDMLGINNEFSPRFLRRYADLYTQMMTGVSRYVEDVKSGDFPSEQEQY